MTEPNTGLFVAPPPPAPAAAEPAPPSDGAALRAELAALLSQELLSRFASAGPRERVLIEHAGILAADLAHLTKCWRPDGDERIGRLVMGGIERVSRFLWELGTDRIAGTFAERILADALAIEDAVLAAMPAAGTA